MIVHTGSNYGRCITYVFARVTFPSFYSIDDIVLIAVVVAWPHIYTGSWYSQTRSGMYYA